MSACSQSGDVENQENQIIEGNDSNEQPPEEAISNPAIFSDMQIPIIDGGYIINEKKLQNAKNKTGMQVWEKSDKSFEDVKAFYLENMEKNGWERKTDADKQSSPEQENGEAPVQYFVTKFHKVRDADKKGYVFLLNITSGKDKKTTVIKILKEM